MKSLRNPNRKPTHPGAVLREDILPELGWTQAELANRLKVSRQTVSQLLHEDKAVTAEMAIEKVRQACNRPFPHGRLAFNLKAPPHWRRCLGKPLWQPEQESTARKK